MRVKKRRSDLDHSVFVLRDGECDQEVNQSECKAETGPADKQVEDKSCCSVFFFAKKSKSKMDILHNFSPFFTPQDWFDAPCFMICNKMTKSVAQRAKKTEKDLCGIFLTIVIYYLQ